MGSIVLDVVGLELAAGAPEPLSFDVKRGEIHGLLFPPAAERQPLLSVLAGLQPPRTGKVSMPSGPMLLRVSNTVDEALSSPADVVLINEARPPANDDVVRDSWARIAGERERGTTIIVATSCEEQAYRSDRVSLAMWDESMLRDALLRLSRSMGSLVAEFLAVFDAEKNAPSIAIASRLRRLNHAARDLLQESRKHARSLERMQAMRALSAELAGNQLDDRVLEAVIDRADDN